VTPELPEDFDPLTLTDSIGLLRFLKVRFLGAIDETHVAAEMPVTDEMTNPLGIPHGGSIATLVDFTAGMACALFFPYPCSTSDLQLRYLAPARGTLIRAEATILRSGKRLVVVEVRVLDEDGTLLGSASLAMAPIIPA
jgi:uncharacterized protein (TIGR00369 family)